MPQPSRAALMTFDKWQQWEGRIVGGRYALLQHLGGSDHGAVYLTEFEFDFRRSGVKAESNMIKAKT